MVTAISFLRLKGWHAPAGRRPGNPGLLSRTGRSGRHRRWVPEKLGPGRQIVSKTTRCGVSRFGGQAGTQVSDATPPPTQNRGSRAGSTTHILPADSERKAALLIWRGEAARSGGYGHPVVGAAAGKDGSAAGRADAADWPGADRAERRGCILVVLLWTLAAASAECAVYRKVWGLFLSHLPYCGTDGRCVARPGRAWR
jgi:hypothetical protein